MNRENFMDACDPVDIPAQLFHQDGFTPANRSKINWKMPDPPQSVPEMLQECLDTFKERAEVYGDNYKKFGQIMDLLISKSAKNHLDFPNGWNRMGLLVQIVNKLLRYSENFERGGHDDSLKDLAVYATMLRSLDKE